MSSLLQFRGNVDHRGVHLIGYSQNEGARSFDDGNDRYHCQRCGRYHERLFTFARKPAGMLGCWVVFRWHGEEHVPDLSLPIGIPGKPPKGAVPMSDEESTEHWHSS